MAVGCILHLWPHLPSPAQAALSEQCYRSFCDPFRALVFLRESPFPGDAKILVEEIAELAEDIKQSPARNSHRIKYPEDLCASGRVGTWEEADSQVVQCSCGGRALVERTGMMGRKDPQAGIQPRISWDTALYASFRWCGLKPVPLPS